jgi:soluble lytic murein transglycosylase-like protein
MECAMSRRFAYGLPVKVVALWLLAVPALACADVLEIDGNGATWVAGGPTVAPPFAVVPTAELIDDPAPVGMAASAPGLTPHLTPALTYVSDTAGPAPWQARLAELAAKYDISPALIEALVWQESRWNSGAVSPKGARGFAQLMPGTARDLGVNAFDPSSNLEGGARYLRAQLDAFGGDLEKALAAYNAGPLRVQRAGGIPRIRETQNYVSAIMARLSAPVRR